MSKLYNIEVLRVVFCILIVYFHIFHANIMSLVGNNKTYLNLAQMSMNTLCIVECFFIMSGYFLFHTMKKKQSFIEFAYAKAIRLLPVLFFSIIIEALMLHTRLETVVINSFFLQCIGLSTAYKSINWYVSPLFWSFLFIYGMRKSFKDKGFYFGLAVIIYFGYLANISLTKGGFSRGPIGLVDLSLTRAIAGVGMGYLVGTLLEEFKKYKINIIPASIRTAFYCVVELFSLGYLLLFFSYYKRFSNNIIVVVVFLIIFCCFIREKGLVGRLLNNSWLGALGKFGYSVYIMQQISFLILKKYFWSTAIIKNPFACISLSLLFSFLVGVAVYYLVEKPCYEYLKNKLVLEATGTEE